MTEQANLPAVRESALTPPSVREVKAHTEAIHQLFTDVLLKETHYGTIPGTPKPTLYKAGAEKIGLLLHLAPTFQRSMQWDGPHLTVISECTLRHQGSGVEIASAGAMCSTRESKYAFRKATRKCPECGKDSIIKGKKEYGGGWICFAKKGGCGAKWPDGDKAIEAQSESQEDNPNLADTYNTVMKMADKRAYVAATLFGTAASDIFTQDVEDFNEYQDPGYRPQPENPATDDLGAFQGMSEQELLDHILDMRGAFSRKEGPEWWKANAAAIREACSPDQWARFETAKDELKRENKAGVGANSGGPASPSPPPGETRNAPPATSLKGRRTDDFNKLRASMDEAYEHGDPELWVEENQGHIDALKPEERKLLLSLMEAKGGE